MDFEIVYALVFVGLFGVVAYFTLRTRTTEAQTKEQKRYEIMSAYKKELSQELKALGSDKEAVRAKKTQLLKKFSDELSRNIFFEEVEIKEIIFDILEEYE